MHHPSKSRLDALSTYIEQPMPLGLACEMALVDESWVQSALAAAMSDDDTPLAACGVRIRQAQAQAVSEQIASLQSKARKDWKANAHLLNAIAPSMAPKTGIKELGDGLKAVAAAVLELPAKVDHTTGLLSLPERTEDES